MTFTTSPMKASPWCPLWRPWKKLRKKDFEVLHMVDPVDEYVVQQVKTFGGKKLKSTTKGRWDLGDEDDKKKLEELEAECEPPTKLMMEVLGGKVENVLGSVVLSLRVLTTSGPPMRLQRWRRSDRVEGGRASHQFEFRTDQCCLFMNELHARNKRTPALLYSLQCARACRGPHSPRQDRTIRRGAPMKVPKLICIY